MRLHQKWNVRKSERQASINSPDEAIFFRNSPYQSGSSPSLFRDVDGRLMLSSEYFCIRIGGKWPPGVEGIPGNGLETPAIRLGVVRGVVGGVVRLFPGGFTGDIGSGFVNKR